MSRSAHPSEAEARRFQALDDLLATPCDLPAGLDERLRSIPDRSRRAARSWITVAAAAAVLVGAALTLRVPTDQSGAADVAEPSRRDRVVVALRHPSELGRTFLADEGDRILVTLHRLARDADPAVAVPAIERLGALARHASLPVLVDVVRRPDRREPALRALGALGDPAAAAAIAPFLSDVGLRVVARDALVAVGGQRAVSALLLLLDDVDHADALVAAIGRVHDPAAVRTLLGLLGRPAVAAAARDALGAPYHRTALLAVARGRDRDLSLAAIRTIGHLAPPEAVPVLRALLASAHRRAAAAQSLAILDTAAAGAALFDHLGARGVRDAFAHAGPGIEAWLVARLREGGRRERLHIVDLLALCGTEASVPVLHGLAADPALAPTTIVTLGRIGGPAAVAVLEELAVRSALRRPVLDVLATNGSPDAIAALVRLGLGERALRRPAITALGRIPHPAAVHGILALDGSVTTRRTTARTLRRMDRDTVVPALLALLGGDRAPEARRWLHTVRP